MSEEEDHTGLTDSGDEGRAPDQDEIQQTTENGAGADDADDADDDDLFGDGDAEEEPAGSPQQRKLDDADLDSGDDLGRDDRMERHPSEQEEELEQHAMEISIARHSVPQPSDNELYLIKVPRFLGIDPVAFHHKSFQPPTTEHHSTEPASSTFSAYNTAMTTLRWRHAPSNPKEIQSNARILRWSDGSLTLQLASDPTNQYEITAKSLAPQQRNPTKPTPTSIKDMRNKHSGTKYDIEKDSFTYLTAPVAYAGVVRTTGKLTAALQIQSTSVTTDEAMEKLEKRIATTGRGAFGVGPTIQFETAAEDPELEKRRAEAAEREKNKMAKTREKQVQREQERASRGFGRAGGRSNLGLSISGLEEEGRTMKGAGRAKPRRKRQDEYSDDEDYGGKRFSTKEDDYDEEDDFIAGSDEEEEVMEDDDPDDGIIESPKRSRGKEDAAGDDDEDDDVATTSRVKRRRVVEEDDDDE